MANSLDLEWKFKYTLNKDHGVTNGNIRRCEYFLARKKRFCKASTRKDSKFCVEHGYLSEGNPGDLRKRITCPLDSKHSCYEDKLSKHLKKCNSRRELNPTYYVENINSGSYHISRDKYEKTIRDLELPDFIILIKRVNECYEKKFDRKIKQEHFCHESLETDVKHQHHNKVAIKHLKQQASIIEHVNTLGMVQDNVCFLEFGAGRGGLSHALAKVCQNFNQAQFILIERGAKDNYHKNLDEGPVFERLRVDIEHLSLDKVESLNNEKQKIAIAKHLCGSAADLMLRCLLETWKNQERNCFKGIVLAVCCHHRCNWESYVGKDFFLDSGFSAEDFHLIITLSSWYTCGAKVVSEEDGKLSAEERSAIGKRCKFLIDYGRQKYLESYNMETEIVTFTDQNVSLENILIKARKF